MHSLYVMIADDDKNLREMLATHLTNRGYKVIVAAAGEIAIELAAAYSVGLALVDVRMPGPSGIELAKRLKDLNPGLEVIIITAYGSVREAVEAMHQGAFYYLLKPLDLKLLHEKVDQAWKKYQERARVQIGELVIDYQESRVTLRGKPIKLTLLEYQILSCLARRRGNIVSHEVLTREAWGYELGVETGAIWTALHRLKRKIGAEHIECFKGKGYLLKVPQPKDKL